MTAPLAILAAFLIGSIFGALAMLFIRPKSKPPTKAQRAFAATSSAEMRVSRMHEIQDAWDLAHRTDSDA